MSQTEQGLQPCPFCGGTGKGWVYRNDYGANFNIDCDDCSGKISSPVDEAEARTAWNTRPIESALRSENEELRAKIALLEKVVSTLRRWLRQGMSEDDLDLDREPPTLPTASSGGINAE